ncbi:hypothetical protein ACQ4PT_071566 [Festuca glaucescens]
MFLDLTDMEAIYKLPFPGQVLHQLWYPPSDDVISSIFALKRVESNLMLTHLHIYSYFQNIIKSNGSRWLKLVFCILACRARYGVQLEKGTFEKRTADFLWMMIFGAISLLVLSAIPFLQTYFLGVPMVSMLLYVWSREYPNSQISMYGLVQLRSFYLPWAMLGLDVIFGSQILPGLLGILVGHLYYFFSVLYPLASGKNYLKTPMWVHKIVARFRIGVQGNAPVRPANTGPSAFRGRGYRLNQ